MSHDSSVSKKRSGKLKTHYFSFSSLLIGTLCPQSSLLCLHISQTDLPRCYIMDTP